VSSTKLVLTAVEIERQRQNNKWGVQNHAPDRWLVILQEEIGEAAKAVLERDGDAYVKEMEQVAAVAVAAVESYLRNGLTAKEPANG
jgi:NTP pyrophosphatase (non-canonical NTP hydrolase)